MEILEIFKYLQYIRLAQMRQTPKLTMNLLCEHEFGSNESNFSPHVFFTHKPDFSDSDLYQ